MLFLIFVACESEAPQVRSGSPWARSDALSADLTFDSLTAAQRYWNGLFFSGHGSSIHQVQIVASPVNELNSDPATSVVGTLEYQVGTEWKTLILGGRNDTTHVYLPNRAIDLQDLHRLRYVRPSSNNQNTFFTYRFIDSLGRPSNEARLYFRKGNVMISNDPLIIATEADIVSDASGDWLYFSRDSWEWRAGSQVVVQFRARDIFPAEAGELWFYASNRWRTQGAPMLHPFSTGNRHFWQDGHFQTATFRFKVTKNWKGVTSMPLVVTDVLAVRTHLRTLTVVYY